MRQKKCSYLFYDLTKRASIMKELRQRLDCIYKLALKYVWSKENKMEASLVIKG